MSRLVGVHTHEHKHAAQRRATNVRRLTVSHIYRFICVTAYLSVLPHVCLSVLMRQKFRRNETKILKFNEQATLNWESLSCDRVLILALPHMRHMQHAWRCATAVSTHLAASNSEQRNKCRLQQINECVYMCAGRRIRRQQSVAATVAIVCQSQRVAFELETLTRLKLIHS